MASLTEISVATRKFLFWLAIVFVLYLILKFIVGIIISSLPKPVTPEAPPNVLFDKIPRPVFSKVTTSSSGMTFVLENIEGKPPETTAAAKIYSMPKKMPSFLSSERAKKIARKIGFTQEPKTISSLNYLFTDPNDPLRTLEFDAINMNFYLKLDCTKRPEVFNHQQLIQKEQAVSKVKRYVQSKGLFDASIANGKIITQLLTFDPKTKSFNPAISLSASNALRIDFYRSDLDGMKVLTPYFNKSYNFVLYTPSPKIPQGICEISYTFWPIDFNNFGTYPLKSSAVAWQDLIDGYAYVINMGNNSPEKIVIRNIYLAYYDSEEPQHYLQPIFVFEGDNNFMAYLPAVDPAWLE